MGFIDDLAQLTGTVVDDTEAIESLTLDAEDEDAIVVAGIIESFGIEEGLAFCIENANQLEAYGIIHNASGVMESARNIVRLNKEAKFEKEKALACLRLARRANDAEYKKYKKFRNLMLESRAKIMTKYESKGTAEARKVIQNSKRKAGNMSSKAGNDLAKKMDSRMKSSFDSKDSKAVAK